jgi:hypothetical protein
MIGQYHLWEWKKEKNPLETFCCSSIVTAPTHEEFAKTIQTPLVKVA